MKRHGTASSLTSVGQPVGLLVVTPLLSHQTPRSTGPPSPSTGPPLGYCTPVGWSVQDAGGLLADVGLANAAAKWSAEVEEHGQPRGRGAWPGGVVPQVCPDLACAASARSWRLSRHFGWRVSESSSNLLDG